MDSKSTFVTGFAGICDLYESPTLIQDVSLRSKMNSDRNQVEVILISEQLCCHTGYDHENRIITLSSSGGNSRQKREGEDDS
jgi:hypothetical protein